MNYYTNKIIKELDRQIESFLLIQKNWPEMHGTSTVRNWCEEEIEKAKNKKAHLIKEQRKEKLNKLDGRRNRN